jgi:hypothetical protein
MATENVPARPVNEASLAHVEQAQEPIDFAVSFKRWEYANHDDERWIAVVVVRDEEFRVYSDTETLAVEPNGCATRSVFGWNDYMLENVKGDVARACMLCALAVALQTD